MIDAASLDSFGDTGSGNYTTVAWVTGAGKGATFTPIKGDTGKTLLIPNAGMRGLNASSSYDIWAQYFSATQRDAANAYKLFFADNTLSGQILSNPKLNARSLRCVRS